MARKTARPGRTLVVFFLGLAIAYGLVALGGTWKPELGLDLQGGTRITLIAKGSPSPDEPRRGREHHRPARQRLRRHRGRGDHAGQPVHRRRDPRRQPPRPRRHRQAPGAAALPPRRVHLQSTARAAASRRRPAPAARRRRDRARRLAEQRARRPSRAASPATSPTASPRTGPPFRSADEAPRRHGVAHREPVGHASDVAEPRRPSPSPSPTSARRRRRPARGRAAQVDEQPRPGLGRGLQRLQVPAERHAAVVDDNPDKPLVTCGTGDGRGVKYLLSLGDHRGHRPEERQRRHPAAAGQLGGQPRLRRRRHRRVHRDLARRWPAPSKQFAIVLDGQVHLGARR